MAVIALMLAALAQLGYKRLDSIGWIPHHDSMNVCLPTGDSWAVGESRVCRAYPLDTTEARLVNRSMELSAIKTLDCRSEENFIYVGEEVGAWYDLLPNEAPVTFWGRTEQPEYEWIRWNCTRYSNSFVCKETRTSGRVLRGTDQSTGRRVKSYDGGKHWEWDN
jgi:hypothetical protein